MEDKNKNLRDAFDNLTPRAELEEKTRKAVNDASAEDVRVFAAQPEAATGGNGRTSSVHTGGFPVKSFAAIIMAFVLIAAIVITIVANTGGEIVANDSGLLRSFSSLSEVERYISARKPASYSSDIKWLTGGLVTDTAEAPAAQSSDAEHSTTNNQVEGVNEADIVHTDGDYIYMLSYYSLSIIDIRGGNFDSVLELEYDGFYPSEMFLTEDSRLVILGSYYEKAAFNADSSAPAISAGYWHANSSAVKVYNVPALLADPTTAPEREMRFENCYLSSSRMIDGKLYMVMNSYLYCRRNIFGWTTVWIPSYYDSLGGQRKLAASDIFATPDNGRSFSFTVIAGVDLTKNDAAAVKAYFGSADTLYASQKAFYITYSRFEKVSYDNYDYYAHTGLGIIRFEISGISLVYKGLGKADGYIINQFAMDEHTYYGEEHDGETYFRIATTAYGNNDSYITVFDADMAQVGKLDGIGEENERIYSVRFSGEEAVVVTYRNMDPLYVINLSDPVSPKIKSALKIAGVSDYLHFLKIKDGYIFAVGRRQDESGSRLDGIKVSLFDISGEETEEVGYYEVDSRGNSYYSSSEATYNHKAVMYFMPQDKSKEVFAFPINIHGYEYKNGTSKYFNISELYYYSVGADGSMTQTVLGYHAEEVIIKYSSYNNSYYSYYRDQIRRSVIAGDYIYLIGYSGAERYNLNSLYAGSGERGDILNISTEYWTRY